MLDFSSVAESNTVPHDHSTQRHVQNMPEFQPAVLHQGGPDARTVRMQQLEQQQKQFDKEIVQESQAYHNENIEEQVRMSVPADWSNSFLPSA